MNFINITKLVFIYCFLNLDLFSMKIETKPRSDQLTGQRKTLKRRKPTYNLQDKFNKPKKEKPPIIITANLIKRIKTKENFIGNGDFKEVYKYRNRAIVFYNKQITFEKELYFFQNYNHKNIISMINFSNEFKVIILEIGEMNLLSLVTNKKLTLIEKLKLFKDITKGLQYLHNNELIHGDLKRSNIIIKWNKQKKRYIAKIIDFHSFVNINEGIYYFSSKYYAPEQKLERDNVNNYPFCTDIYNLGSIFYHTVFNSPKIRPSMLTRDRVNKTKNLKTVEEKNKKWFESFFYNIDEIKLTELKNLIINCLNFDLNLRPNTKEIVSELEEAILKLKKI
ncbi:MAG: protein kinase [bacterium]